MLRTASSPPDPTVVRHLLGAGTIPEETQVIIVLLGKDWFTFQTDDGFLLLDVGRKGHAYTTYRMIDEAVDEEGDIDHEFAHQRRIRYFIDGPLQDVGFSDAFEKGVNILTVGDETGLVKVPSTAIVRGMIILVSSRVLVPENEPVTEVYLERVGMFLELDIQRNL